MTKKYIKKIIATLIIIGFVCNGYCAEQIAVDGTTFVTKKEFDLALSDFNTRLTKFEAGIESKIDAQVSSYLDRNGIWSAVEQNIKYPTYTYDMSIFKYWSANCSSIVTGANENIINADLLIEKCTKSGLLYYTFELVPDTGTDKRCCECFVWYDAYDNTIRHIVGSKYTTPCTTRCLDCTVVQTDETAASPYVAGVNRRDLTTINFGKATAQIITDDNRNATDNGPNYDGFYTVNKSTNDLHHYINIPLVASLGVRSCLTFVEKNKKIWIEIKDTLSFTSTNMVAAMSNTNITKTDYSFGKLRLIDNKAVVY